MSRGRGIKPGGLCFRCAYFGLKAKAVTNISHRPGYGAFYCKDCADYLRDHLYKPSSWTERRSPPQTTHHDKEAT